MVQEQRDVFYYVTVMNENYAQPTLPAGGVDAIREGIVKGIYRIDAGTASGQGTVQVQLLGSGAILNEVIAAQKRREPGASEVRGRCVGFNPGPALCLWRLAAKSPRA